MKKKWLISLVAVVLLMVGAYKLVKSIYFGGENYYVQVTTDGKKETFSGSGATLTNYHYTLNGYNDEGHEKKLAFSTVKEQPLRKMAYLKVTYNTNKGVTMYQEIKASDLPEKAKEKLAS
ncbi:YxeA family protein [Enterococcus camelliae]|uniref:YxeA family protein n=1 Tax=Enterococcus camelliae TaxID=453959 RepID=A0ABW5TIC5_9ENTE